MNKRLAITLMLVLLTGCYKPISGTVVDADTNAPIEGAVVMVEWTKTHGIGDHWTESYKVAETVTDKEGKFTLPGCYRAFVNEPDVTIYKKGYVAWSSRWIFPDRRKRTDFMWGDSVLKLEVFKKEYSYLDHTDFIRASINASINIEAKKSIYIAFRWETQLASEEMDRSRKKNKNP
jgi:hypothetical protein